jgi:tetratricopeptide (TPR) repeat protein
VSDSVQLLFKRGVRQLNQGQLSAAITTFSQVIDSPEADVDLKAYALNYRGFAYLKTGNEEVAAGDWKSVLNMSAAPAAQGLMARAALGRLHAAELLRQAESNRGSDDSDAALAQCEAILDQKAGHDFDKWMAAQALLQFPNLPADLAQKADRASGAMKMPPAPTKSELRGGFFRQLIGTFAQYSLSLGLFLALILIPIWWMQSSNEAQYEASRRAKENIRHAKDILRMWSSGVSPESVPYLLPEKAEKLLEQTVSSDAEDELKEVARRLLGTMKHHGHFFTFANNFVLFEPDVDRIAELAGKATPRQLQSPDLDIGEFKAGFLVVTTRLPEGVDTIDVPFFDSEMIEACGKRVAKSPSDLRTVVALEWNRTQIGEYHVVGFEMLGNRVEYTDEAKQNIPTTPMYRHECVVNVFNYESRTLLAHNRFEASDPETMTIGGGANDSSPGYAQLRKAVREFIRQLTDRGA